MCGRYYLVEDENSFPLFERFRKKYRNYQLELGEIFPSNQVMSFANIDQSLEPLLLTWGYSWDKKIIINSRIETIKEKTMFKDDYQNYRCVLPANGFYEWDQQKVKHYIQADNAIFYLAAIYNPTTSRMSIITKPANLQMATIHSRMPIILNGKQASNYCISNDYHQICLESNPSLIIHD